MVISGILVACRPEHMDELSALIERFDWAKVHHRDAEGRMVITVEAENTDQGMDRLVELKQLPRVLMADMVEHYFEEESHPDGDESTSRGLDKLNKDV